MQWNERTIEIARNVRGTNQFFWGYNAGPIDGVIGRATVSALKQFQHDNGTTPTGTQDYSTIRLLKALRQC
ncbi:peptidoglycan-binding domain-containing protein [Marinobacter sp. LV10MA510-1]|uniref:peptidoglycan-binding domain-containing protein n=1 Tax=Marinobacter sp. LV10MA510-1 TaxID=1415567 RepID=UPI001C54F31D